MTNPMKIWDPSDAEADPLDEKSEPEDFWTAALGGTESPEAGGLLDKIDSCSEEMLSSEDFDLPPSLGP